MSDPLRHSPLVAYLRVHGFLKTGGTSIVLARTTGMCKGVRRALAMVERARASLPRGRRLALLHPIIHNPTVGRWLQEGGVHTLDTAHDRWWMALSPTDTVVVPAFGATVSEEEALRAAGVRIIDTTCPSVRGVWARVSAYAKDGFTTVLHGRSDHPETRATLSRATAAGGHYLVVRDRENAQRLAAVIALDPEADYTAVLVNSTLSPGFDPARDVGHIGLVNQTTMLAEESMEIAALLRDAFVRRHGPRDLESRFRTFGTICRATQERQNAIEQLTGGPLDVLFVVGGHASSNTRNLAELGARRVPTFHVEGAASVDRLERIRHQPPATREVTMEDVSWLAHRSPRVVGFAGGASTPDAEVGETMVRLLVLLKEPLPPVAEEERVLAATA